LIGEPRPVPVGGGVEELHRLVYARPGRGPARQVTATRAPPARRPRSIRELRRRLDLGTRSRPGAFRLHLRRPDGPGAAFSILNSGCRSGGIPPDGRRPARRRFSTWCPARAGFLGGRETGRSRPERTASREPGEFVSGIRTDAPSAQARSMISTLDLLDRDGVLALMPSNHSLLSFSCHLLPLNSGKFVGTRAAGRPRPPLGAVDHVFHSGIGLPRRAAVVGRTGCRVHAARRLPLGPALALERSRPSLLILHPYSTLRLRGFSRAGVKKPLGSPMIYSPSLTVGPRAMKASLSVPALSLGGQRRKRTRL